MVNSVWRLIYSPQPAPGAWNMALDEAILEMVEAGLSQPTLRLYAWQPECLSIGYAQFIGDIDMVALAALNWDLVRRPTGGRAILHTDEITYSVIGKSNEPRLRGSVLESYCRLAQALLRTLSLLGVPALARESAESASKQPNPVCFEVPSNYEITVDGKKLLGSAQARRRTGVLQHGALPLIGDLTRITRGLNFPDETARHGAALRLLQHATTVEQVTGTQISWDEAASAFIQGFEETLDLELAFATISPAEQSLAEKLVLDKYDNDHWTRRM